MINEALLSHIWQYRLYDIAEKNLCSSEGEGITILQTGTKHSHAGPDFFNAHIKIGDTLWAGNVEIHTKASHWLQHRHQNDRAYDSVILHVVYENDAPPLHRTDGTCIPTLELKSYLPLSVVERYRLLQHAPERPVPCAAIFPKNDILRLSFWLDRLLAERLEQKTALFQSYLGYLDNDWESAFYWALARAFGAPLNSDVFEQVARSLPLLVLRKEAHQPHSAEALLLGQSGFLETVPTDDTYALHLREHYLFLQHKYQLQPITVSQWKFLRLRPAHFPTLRLAQLAAILQKNEGLFSKIIAAPDLKSLKSLLKNKPSVYWDTHYMIRKSTKASTHQTGEQFLNTLLINTVIPAIFVYGRIQAQAHLEDKALNYLTALPAEKNSIISDWAALGWKAADAHQSQALLQLRKHYCDAKRCLECAIGAQLLKG